MINDQDKEIQIIRKKNLRKAILDRFSDNIDEFAAAVDKHRNFIYALLWDVNNPNNRKITDKMARFLEKQSGIPDGYLDSADTNSLVINGILNIPYLDIETSTRLQEMKYSSERSFPILSTELNGKPVNSLKDLFAVRIFDNSLFPHVKFGDTVLIDYSMRQVQNNQYYLVKYYGIFYIRKAKIEQGKLLLCSHISEDNDSQLNGHQITVDDKKLEILGIVVFMFIHSQPYFRS